MVLGQVIARAQQEPKPSNKRERGLAEDSRLLRAFSGRRCIKGG